MKNFINPAITIHQRHQKLVASYQLKTKVDFINYYENVNRTQSPLVQLPSRCKLMPASLSPYSTTKYILRKLKMRNDLYLKASAFYQFSGEIFVKGLLLRKKHFTNSVGSTSFVKFGNLFQLDKCYEDEKCIKFTDLHYSNDFLFVFNNLMYLLEWIQ